MPTFRITAPDGATYEVVGPEGATEQDALAQVQAQLGKPKADPLAEARAQQMSEMSGPQKFLAAMGKAPSDLYLGARQILGNVQPGEVDERRRLEKPLLNTGAGTAGNIAGSVATLAPALVVPGANTVAGAGVVGALSGALQPTSGNESRMENAAVGGLVGAGSQYGIGKALDYAGGKLVAKQAAEATRQGANAVKDEAIAAAKDAGYKTIPSVSNGSAMGKFVEGATGKVKAKQMASVKNQEVTDALVRKGLGLAEDAPITKETMQAVRSEAAAVGYAPVREVPQIQTDNVFRAEIGKLTSRADNASKDFGELVKSDVKPFADELLKVKSFSGDAAVDQVSILREAASDAYASGNKTLGKAYRGAAESIEAQIERGLAKQGKDGAALIKNFREARTKMAQTFDVEKGLREGQGHVDARALGKIFSKSPDRLTGELRTIGRSAAAMPDVMAVPKDGWANHFTALDSTGSTLASIISGTPLPLGVPVARAGARMGLLSDMGQRMTKPVYGPSAMQKLTPEALAFLEKYGAGGVIGAGYAGKQ